MAVSRKEGYLGDLPKNGLHRSEHGIKARPRLELTPLHYSCALSGLAQAPTLQEDALASQLDCGHSVLPYSQHDCIPAFRSPGVRGTTSIL